MKRIIAIEPAGIGQADDAIELDFDHRNRRRIVFETQKGARVLLDMPSAVHLRGGDRLRLEDGGLVEVHSADETLLEIGARDGAALVRIAWHLGNRHLPTQLLPGADGGILRIREDHVIEEMVIGLGATCRKIAAPFDPEGGAYAGQMQAHGHAHGHHHDHDHDHDDRHDHSHAAH